MAGAGNMMSNEGKGAFIGRRAGPGRRLEEPLR